MSRTDAHRPLWSRFGDPAVWFEVHDHRFGPCDLLPLEEWVASLCEHSCRWEVDRYAVPPSCGCAMCTNRHWRRITRRAERRGSKAALRRGDWRDEFDA